MACGAFQVWTKHGTFDPATRGKPSRRIFVQLFGDEFAPSVQAAHTER